MIYDPITWTGILGIGLPIALVLVGILFLFFFEYMTKLKLKKQGHTKIIEILEGRRSYLKRLCAQIIATAKITLGKKGLND